MSGAAILARERFEKVAGEEGANGASGKELVANAAAAAGRLFASARRVPDEWLWLHSVDLWDYLPGPSRKEVQP